MQNFVQNSEKRISDVLNLNVEETHEKFRICEITLKKNFNKLENNILQQMN